MNEIRFPEYRLFVDRRSEANNAMIALLAGSSIGAHMLKLTEGSTSLLPDMFPAVPHIHRFNLRTSKAQEILEDSSGHVSMVAVPYALSIHEHFIMKCLDWLVDIDALSKTKRKDASPKRMHELLFQATTHSSKTWPLSAFHLLRTMRNAQIHAGGAADNDELAEAIHNIQSDHDEDWSKISGRSASEVVDGGTVHFTVGDTIAVFATSKALGREVNAALASGVNTGAWADLAVDDYQLNIGCNHIPNSSKWRRACVGYARKYYSHIQLGEEQLLDAATKLGHWKQ